jgi:hypothetical protein
MKMDRRSFLFYLCYVILIFTGCHSPSEEVEPIRIAYIAKLKNESFHDGIAAGVRKEMAQRGVHVDIIYPESYKKP